MSSAFYNIVFRGPWLGKQAIKQKLLKVRQKAGKHWKRTNGSI